MLGWVLKRLQLDPKKSEKSNSLVSVVKSKLHFFKFHYLRLANLKNVMQRTHAKLQQKHFVLILHKIFWAFWGHFDLVSKIIYFLKNRVPSYFKKMNFPSLQTDHYLLRKLEYKRTDKKVDMISAYLQTSPKVRLHHFPPFQSPNHTENPKKVNIY